MSRSLHEGLSRALHGRRDVQLAVIFGSRARGTGRQDSDVDVAVLGEGLDLATLGADLGRAIRREVDVVDLARASYPLLKAVLRDGIVVHEGCQHAEARWRASAIARAELDRPWFERMRDAYLENLASKRSA